jgi:CheY-like chemotaxis protein
MIVNKILMIVDDDEDDRAFFIDAIREINPCYDYFTAKNGLDALDQLRNMSRLPDFIFLDVNMPVMNGRECLKELKKDVKLKNIPVIIYSSSSFNQHIDFTDLQGVAHFLPKVYDLSKLPAAIYDTIISIESIEPIKYF